LFFRNKKQAPLNRAQSLKTVPIKNRLVEETRTDDGTVNLFIPRRETWWIKTLSKVFFIPKGRKIALDELGSAVWEWIDEKNNVEQLITKFAEHFKLSKREAELSMVSYLRMLGKRGLIGIAVVDQTNPAGGREKKKSKGAYSRQR